MATRTDAEFYSVAEAARLLRVSPSTVWRWVASEKLPAYRVGPKTIRIKQADLEALLQPARAARKETTIPLEHPGPTPHELARRQALVRQILTNRARRVIAPLSAAELVQEARTQAQRLDD